MKLTRFSAIVILTAMLLTLASCDGLYLDADDTDDAVITESLTNTAPTIDDYINGELPLPAASELHLLGGDITVERFDDKNCAAVYNDHGAWIFDYELSRITPLVDLDEMLMAADPTGRGHKYFEDVTVDCAFHIIQADNISIHCTVRSTDYSGARYSIHNTYYLGFNHLGEDERGKLSEYSGSNMVYPGSEEPYVITDVSELKRYYYKRETSGIRAVRAFITGDTDTLEGLFGVDKGLLSAWSDAVIRDYIISDIRPYPNHSAEEFIVEATIENSPSERYPDGRYSFYFNCSSALDAYRITGKRLDGDMPTREIAPEYKAVADWVYPWARTFGGSLSVEKQVVGDIEYDHAVYGYLYSLALDKEHSLTGNMYLEYAEKYLGLSGLDNLFSSFGDDIIDAFWREPNRICEVAEVKLQDGVYTVTVNYFADPLKTITARTHVFTVTPNNDGTFCIRDCKCTYDQHSVCYE